MISCSMAALLALLSSAALLPVEGGADSLRGFEATLDLEQSEEERILNDITLHTSNAAPSDDQRLNNAQVSTDVSSSAEQAKAGSSKIENFLKGQLSEWCAKAKVSTAQPALHEPLCGVFIQDSQGSNKEVETAVSKHPMLSCAYSKLLQMAGIVTKDVPLFAGLTKDKQLCMAAAVNNKPTLLDSEAALQMDDGEDGRSTSFGTSGDGHGLSSFQDVAKELFPSLDLDKLPFKLPTVKLDRMAITIPEGASSLLETSEVSVAISNVAAFDLPSKMGKLNIKKIAVKVANPFKDTRAIKSAGVSAVWSVAGLFKADVDISMATDAGKHNLTVIAGLDLSGCQSRVCAFVKSIMGSYKVGATGSITGFSFSTGSSGELALNTVKSGSGTGSGAEPGSVVESIVETGTRIEVGTGSRVGSDTRSGAQVVQEAAASFRLKLTSNKIPDGLSLKYGDCVELGLSKIWLQTKGGEICMQFSAVGLTFAKVAKSIGFDINSFKLPKFLGSITSAQCLDATAMVSGTETKKLRGIRVIMQVGSWKHSAQVETWNNTHFALSSKSPASYSLSEILESVGAKLDISVANGLFTKLQVKQPSVEIAGTTASFGMVMSATVIYKDLSMKVTVSVSGLPSAAKPAVVLKIHTADAFPKLLSYLGIPIPAGIPEMRLGGIQIAAISSNFSMSHLRALAAASGLPAADPGVYISADISWTTCNRQFCKAISKIFNTEKEAGVPGSLRLQGGVSATGFSFNIGQPALPGVGRVGWRPKQRTGLPGTPATQKLQEVAKARVQTVWPGIKNVFPLVWGKCLGNDKPEMDLKNLTGFQFPDTLTTDVCAGVVEAQDKLTYPNLAPLFGLPTSMATPAFLKVNISKLAVKTFMIRLRNNVPKGAFVQITGPDVALKIGPVSLGVTHLLLDASTTGELQLCGTGSLSGHEASIKMPFCASCNWKNKSIGALKYTIPANLNLRTILTIAGGKKLLSKIDIPSQAGKSIVDSFLNTNLADFKLSEAAVKNAAAKAKAALFADAEFSFSPEDLQLGPSLLIKDPRINLKIVDPFTANMSLGSFGISGTFTFPALNNFNFSAKGTYVAPQGDKAGSLAVQAVFGKESAIHDPLGIKGLVITPQNFSIAMTKWPKDTNFSKLDIADFTKLQAPASIKGKSKELINTMNAVGAVKFDFTNMPALSFAKPFIGDLSFVGIGGAHWHDGLSLPGIVGAVKLPKLQVPKDAPIIVEEAVLQLGPTTPTNPGIRAKAVIKLQMGKTASRFALEITFDKATKSVVFSAGLTGCIDVVKGLTVCNVGLETTIIVQPLSVKRLMLKGTVKFTKDFDGLLKQVLRPLESLSVFISWSPKFGFRLGIQINIDISQTKGAVSVKSTSIFIQFSATSGDFSLGGSITCVARLGDDKENYPTFTVTLAYSLVKQRLDFDGSFDGCWNQAFGVAGLSLCDMFLGLSIGVVPPYLTRYTVGSTIKAGDITLKMGLAVDLLTPTKVAMLVHYKGNIDFSQLTGVVKSLLSKSGQSKPSATPTVPSLTLQELLVTVAASDVTIGTDVVGEGFSFKTAFTLFGVRMNAALKINIAGVMASFNSTRIDFIPGLKLCKDNLCNKESGPSFDLKLTLVPPSFELKAELFADLAGNKFGASVHIKWSGAVSFEVVFKAYPLQLVGTTFEVLSGDPATPNMGPLVDFDSKKLLLKINGRVKLLTADISANLHISKTKFDADLQVVFKGFAFDAEVHAAIGSDGQPGNFAAKMVARGTSLAKIGGAADEMLAALAKKAEAKVRAAKKGVRDAQRKVNSMRNKVNSAKRKLKSTKRKLKSACKYIYGNEVLAQQAVSEILAEENYEIDFKEEEHPADQDLEVAVHHIYEDDHSVLNSMTSQYETLDEVPDTLSSRRRLMSEMKLADGAITEDDLPDDDEAEDGLREDEPPAKTRDLVRQLQRPLKSRDDVDLRDDMKPRGSVNLLAIGSRGWHRHRPHHHWHDWKKAACRKAMAPFNVLLRGAKLALSGVNRLLQGAKWVLKKMKRGLNVVLRKMKDGLAAAKGKIKVEYMKATATIKKELLKSSISALIKIRVNGKLLTFSGTINLSSISSFITMIFKNIVKELSKSYGEYSVEEVVAMDEAQMDEMFMQTSANID